MRRQGGNSATAFKLARLYLRVSQPKEALAEIEKLGKLSSEETRLADLLRDTLANPNPQLTDRAVVGSDQAGDWSCAKCRNIEVS